MLNDHTTRRRAAFSDVGFLGDLKRVVNLNAEVAHGQLDLGMAKQELHRTQVPRPPVDQSRFGTPHRMRGVLQRIEADSTDPL